MLWSSSLTISREKIYITPLKTNENKIKIHLEKKDITTESPRMKIDALIKKPSELKNPKIPIIICDGDITVVDYVSTTALNVFNYDGT